MKKRIIVILGLLLLCSCGNNSQSNKESSYNSTNDENSSISLIESSENLESNDIDSSSQNGNEVTLPYI